METISILEARRLALARAGLLSRRWSGLPERGRGRGLGAALEVIRRFGYLQLDTVAVAGARSHAIVLLSRIENLDAELAEELLRPGRPLFEFWGHEVSWIPHELYPAFGFRRRAYAEAHPWWGDLIGAHPEVADRLRRRIRNEGPLRTSDMEGSSGKGWWDLKVAKKVATALWSSGELAIRERRGFQRVYDLAERVIPEELRDREDLGEQEALEVLLLRALAGHGWARTATLRATWRLRGRSEAVAAALDRLAEDGRILPCVLENPGGRPTPGWIRPADRELAARLVRLRPRSDRAVLLSPFDPLLWDRGRVERLFSFEQVLEIFKPADRRKYGYYCLPILAGDVLIGRVDLKADRGRGRLRVLSLHYEGTGTAQPGRAVDAEAAGVALRRFAGALGLSLADAPA